jgi:hypothetical protein
MEREDPRLARSKGRMRCQFCRELLAAGAVYVQATEGDFRGICVPCWDADFLGPLPAVDQVCEAT